MIQPYLDNLRPMLAVTDLPRTIAFYRDVLGFTCMSTFGNPPVWAEMKRDGVSMMFNTPPRECVERDVPRKSKDYQVFYVSTPDVVGLHAELLSCGAKATDLRVTVYGMKEFEIRDPDDYWLWFGQPTDDPPTVRE